MHIQKNKIAVALSCAAAMPLWAQTAQLPTVTVVANPIIEAVRTDAYSAVSAVVTESQLKDLNAVDLASALRRTPGVSISRYNPVGSFGGDQGGAVMIRGMGASRPGAEIMTYIDGIPFYMPNWGHPLLDMLPVNGMSSITVLKGPQPHMAGNNFASINLETKKPIGDTPVGNLRTSWGRFNTVTEQADLVGRSGAFEYSLAQGYAKSDGPRANADGTLNNAMGRVAAKLNQNWSAGIGFLAVDTEVGDPANTNRYDIKANSVNTFLNHQHGDWNGELKVFYNSGYAISTQYSGKYEFVHSGVRWSEQFKPWLGGGVKLGVDYDSTDGTNINTSTGVPTNLTAIRWTSPYIALNHSFGISDQWAITPSIGYRGYSHSLNSSKGTPFAGLTLASDSLRYFANVSTGLKYPGLELQSFAAQNAAALTAEKVDHKEFGVGYRPSNSTDMTVSVFQDRVTNRYYAGGTWGTNNGFGQTWYQTGAYDIRGLEFTLKQTLSREWNLFLGATYLDPSLYNLPYAPDLAITLGLTGKLGPLNVSIDAQSQTSFYGLNWGRVVQGSGSINSSSTTKLDGFTVVNTRLGYPVPALGKRGEVFLALENLTDENYRYRSESSYQMPGRWAQIGLVASFN